MFSKPQNTGGATVPSRNALRVLRQLALAGSTVGSVCTIAALTYEVHRRVRVAERIIENKRTLQSSAPNYDATSAAKRLARMMEAAEAGEFMGLESMKADDRRRKKERSLQNESDHDALPWDGYPDRPLPEVGMPLEGLLRPLAPQSSPEIVTSKPPRAERPGQMKTWEHWEPSPVLHPQEKPLQGADNAGQQSRAKRPNPTATEPKTESHRGSNDDAELSIPDQIRDLLDRDRAIEAAQLFLDKHPASLKGISVERKELAIRVFMVNCKQGNVFMARSIFERLEAVDTVTATMWKVLILALARKGSIESVAALYTRYMNEFNVPVDMIDIVLRALLESHRLTTAKRFLFRNLKHDQQCGLCGTYLHGLWKKTRSVELINGQLKKLLTFLARLGKPPTEKLFNPVLRAYIDFGRPADAEALVADMVEKYNIPLSCRTKGLLVYSRALRCEWDEVELGLEEMHKLGFTKDRVDFLKIFDRIFLEYWVVNKGVAIRDFIFRSIDRFNIVPDKVLYKHMLEALVEKGDNDMLAEFIQLSKDKSWKIPIDEGAFLDSLRARRLAVENSPVGFWQMLQAARVKYGQSATSQQILGYDKRSFPMPEVNKMPFTAAPLPWYERLMEDVVPSKSIDQYQPLDRQMAHYIHAGKMTEALKCFQKAKGAQLQLKPLHVELAATATILEHGLVAARELVETEWKGIKNQTSLYPLFFQQIMEVDPSNEAEVAQLAVFRFYELCWEHPRLIVKHHITVGTSRKLILQNKPEVALQLMKAVYISRHGREQKFDGTCMKMFARAFATTNNRAGIRWCILTALSRDTALNHDLVVEIRRIVASLRTEPELAQKKGKSPPRYVMRRLRYLDHLEFLATLLENKSKGDPALLQLRANRAKRRFIHANNIKPEHEQATFDFSDVKEIVESWDEERELERLFVPSSTKGRRETLAQWSEDVVLQDDSDVEASVAAQASS
ncbi:hypothetical protein DTO271D3_2214 [Paecilomyces variotii]|nr:hypothetical protein DTO271D3_2214 [Paecilomyces variotii]KAJ9392014.1 hypothetical protein DTO063F5_773 [Paecilomyces variotii]